MDFSDEIQRVLDAMSVNNKLVVIGSSVNKNILYSADFDCNETVTLKQGTATSRAIQKVVKRVHRLPYTYVIDFKAGELTQFKVLTGDVKKDKLVGYNKAKSLEVLETLKPFIPAHEYTNGVSVLNQLSTPIDFLNAKCVFKYHTIHWTYEELCRGSKKIYDVDVSLQDAIQMKTPVKIDVITLLYNSKFVEFSCIYFIKKGKRFINLPGGIENLEYEAISLLEDKNYFKYLKRVYSLSQINKHDALNSALESYFNSKNGMLYLFVVGLEVLMNIMENVKNLPLKKINYEIDFFKTLVVKYGKDDFYDQLKDLEKRINVEKLSKLHKDAYDLLQVNSKAFLQELQKVK